MVWRNLQSLPAESEDSLNSSWNIGSIGMAGPPLRGPSSTRLIGEPPLSPPVSSGASPVASAQPIEPATPLVPPMTPGIGTTGGGVPDGAPRPASSLESLLMRFRLITSEQLDEALREKLETGKDVGAIVVERGWVNEDQLARLLSYAPAFSAPVEAAPSDREPHADTETVATPEPATPSEAEQVAEAAESAPAIVEPAPEQPEPATFAAGPVVATEPEPATLAPPDSPALSQPVFRPAPLRAFEVPPALELVEPEAAVDSDAPAALEPVSPLVEESSPEPLLALPAAVEAPAAHPVPLAPLQPVAEPTETVEPASQPAPVAAEAEPAPEPVAVAEPAPAPEPTPQAQTVRFVEPAAVETIARVFVRLSNGERVEAGSFDDVGAAKGRAEEVMNEVSAGERGWPFFGGRYIRPDAIVSVDIDATVVRYA